MYDCVCFFPRQGKGGFHRRVTLAGDLRARCLNAARGRCIERLPLPPNVTHAHLGMVAVFALNR